MIILNFSSPSVEIIRCSTNTLQDSVLPEITNGALISKNGAGRTSRNNSVDSIIDNLKANRQNDLQNNTAPPLLEPYDFGDSSPYYSDTNGDSEFGAKKLKQNGTVIKNNNNNNTAAARMLKVENVFDIA